MSDAKRVRNRTISRRDFMRAAAAGTLGLTLGGLLAACQGSTPPQQVAPQAPPPQSAPKPSSSSPTQVPATAVPQKQAVGGTVTIGIGTDPVTLDPHVSSDAEAGLLYLHIYDCLLRWDEKGNRALDLAESVEAVGDSLSWMVTLRKGIKFQDGSPFNAEAVKRSFERHMDPKARRDKAIMPPAFKSIDVVNDSAVKFVTMEPFAPFRNMAAYYNTGIVSPTAVEKYGEDLTNHPVGTGAFMFKERVKGDRVVMVANPEYWGGRPKLNQLVFRTVKEDTTRILMLEAGELDVALRVPPTEVERLKSNPDVELLVNEGVRSMFLAINTERKPFDDVRVRHALNYAVDKQAIVTTILKGTARVADAPISPKLWGYAQVGTYDYNPEKARQLLRDAGAEGITIKMGSGQGKEPFDRQVAEAVHGQFLAIGLKAELQVVGDWPAYRAAAEKGEFDICLDAYGMSAGDPNLLMSALLEGRWVGKAGQRNYSRYRSAKFDQLLDAGQTTLDETQRKKIYADALKLVFDDAPWVFLHINNMYYAVRKTVQGVRLPSNDRLDFRSAWKQG